MRITKKQKEEIIKEYERKKKGVDVGSLLTYMAIFGSFYALAGGS